MNITDLSEWLAAAKSTLELIKGIREELPPGPEAEELKAKIEQAEEALRVDRAKLAKSLGYHLCRCEFPPEPMLWRNDEEAHICPKCGRSSRPRVIREESSWIAARR